MTPFRLRTAALLVALLPACAHAAFDADKAWQNFLASARFEQVNAAYQVLGTIGYDGRHVDAAACRDARKTLDDAVRAVPVGLALRHASMLCAGATGDSTRADAELEAVGALSRRGLRAVGRGVWSPPIQVVRPEDVLAFLAAAGLEEHYAYYEDLHVARGFPRTVMAYDAESRSERELRFDWIDTLVRLKSDNEFDGYPIRRTALANAFLDAWQGDDDASADALALRAAWMESDPAKKRDLLKAGASRGGVASLQGWIEICRAQSIPGCTDGFVDALLPLAEQAHAIARAQLALAYLEGIGVKADADAAKTLVDAADRTWAEQGASVYLGAVLMLHNRAWPDWLAARVGAAADRGNGAARALRITRTTEKAKSIPAGADRAFLESAQANAGGRGFALLAKLAEAVRSPEAAAFRRRAAAAGDASSERALAVERLSTNAADVEALAMLRDAADAGDAGAARALAYREVLAKNYASARAWLLGAIVRADVDAMLMLAGLQENGLPGVGSVDDARSTYESLAAEVPAAKRSLASMLLDGRGVAKDAARARRLLEEGAAANDVMSQVMLAGGLATGRFGKTDADAARRWFEKAAASGDAAAKSQYGMWLARTATTPAEQVRSIGLLREAAAGGDLSATNGLAWTLCVAPDPGMRDPKAGLAAAKQLGDARLLSSGVRDTVAACHAANGEFEEAIRLQSLALEALPAEAAFDATRKRMRGRLDLYRAGKPYVSTAAEL